MNRPPRASVVIPSWQSAGTIGLCLKSVLAQDLGDAFEVVVVDSGSDATADIVRREFPAVRLLHSNTRVSAELARNWGAREARASILAFLDSDCIAERDWLRRLCVTLDQRLNDGIGGAVRPVDRSNAVAWAGYFCEFREFLPGGGASAATYLTPNNAAYRRDTFLRAGGFADGYFPLEDQVFYRRLHRVGARIRLDRSIVVKHHHRSVISGFLTHQVRIGDANARVARAIGAQGAWIASHPVAAMALLPALAPYRFARTVAACWRAERYLLLRRPDVASLCWLGMWAWAFGFVKASAGETVVPQLTMEDAD